MKHKWNGPDGYVPGIGDVRTGMEIEIADTELARKLEVEGKAKPLVEKKPQAVKDKGGE